MSFLEDALEAAVEGLKIHLTKKFAAEVSSKTGRPPGQCIMLIITEAQKMNMPHNYFDSKQQLEENFGKTGTVTMYRDKQYRRFIYKWRPK